MKRLFSFVLALVFGLQPVFAFAAFETPSALLDAIRMDTAPRIIKGEVHANIETATWVSVWFDAAQEGKNIETGKGNMKVTVDVVNTDENIKGRFKGEVRVVEQKLFIKLDTAEGTFENDNVLATAKVVLKKWVEVPLDHQEHDVLGEVDDIIDSSFANEMFNLSHVQSAIAHSYTLTLKPEVVQDIAADIQGGSADFSLKIDTNLSDIFQTGKVTVNFMSDTANVHGTATMQRSKTALNIAVPAGAVSMDDLYKSLPAAMGMNPVDSVFGLPISDGEMYGPSNDDWMDEEDTGDDQWTDEWELPETQDPIVQPTAKPSRRSIINNVREQRASTVKARTPARNTSTSTLDDHGLVIGRADAPITIVEFGDYECPFCGRHFADTMPALMKEYINTGKVRYVFRNFPLAFHPGALPAAVAVECALEQGNVQAVELHDAIYTAVNGGLELTMNNIQDWSKTITSIDSAEFRTCTTDESSMHSVDADIEAGTRAGVMGTPAFFILGPNGEEEQITGAYPIDEFRRVIDGILGE